MSYRLLQLIFLLSLYNNYKKLNKMSMKSEYGYDLENSWINENNIDNYKAFNKLMETFEFVGVFSDKLVKKVFSLAIRMIDIKNKLLDKKISQKDADIKYREITSEFAEFLNAYCIFSSIFKSNCIMLFISIGL